MFRNRTIRTDITVLLLLPLLFLQVQLTVAWTNIPPTSYCIQYDSISRTRRIGRREMFVANAVPSDHYNMFSDSSHLVASSSSIDAPDLPNLLVPLLAIILLVASQTFINNMLNGDQGLGAYLKDGRGVGRSSFRPLSLDDKNRAVASDPLPWLKLPKLDFVQVAGQEETIPELSTSDDEEDGRVESKSGGAAEPEFDGRQ